MGKKDERRKIARYYEIQLFDESKRGTGGKVWATVIDRRSRWELRSERSPSALTETMGGGALREVTE